MRCAARRARRGATARRARDALATASATLQGSPTATARRRRRRRRDAALAARARTFASRASDGLIAPHGGALVNLMLEDDGAKARAIASCTRALELSDRNACDVGAAARRGGSRRCEGS